MHNDTSTTELVDVYATNSFVIYHASPDNLHGPEKRSTCLSRSCVKQAHAILRAAFPEPRLPQFYAELQSSNQDTREGLLPVERTHASLKRIFQTNHNGSSADERSHLVHGYIIVPIQFLCSCSHSDTVPHRQLHE